MKVILNSVGFKGINNEDDVIIIQDALNQAGVDVLVVDGDCGPHTEDAIILFQKNNLHFTKPDGRIDPNGTTFNGLFDAVAEKLARVPFSTLFHPSFSEGEEDYNKAAELLGVEVAVIKSIAKVESNGTGYFDNGRPKILFEAHKFSKYTHHQYDDIHPDISSRKWNRDLYVGGIAEYERLEKAYSINPTAALKSTSYGSYQIMGFNHESCGYNSVVDFVKAMMSPELGLLALCSFIKDNRKMHTAAKTKNWATFAKMYNGPAYRVNNYDDKLDKYYKMYS